jgi:hypothetical protein
MAVRKLSHLQETQKSDQQLHVLFEEAKKLPIRRRVPHFEQLLKDGTIDEPAYAFLASWSIGEILDDSKRSAEEYPKLYLEFGSRRLFNLHSRKNWLEIREQGRQRWLAEGQEASALVDKPELRLTMYQYRRMESVWYLIGELSDMIDPPKSGGGRLICLGIVNNVLGDVIQELKPQVEALDVPVVH